MTAVHQMELLAAATNMTTLDQPHVDAINLISSFLAKPDIDSLLQCPKVDVIVLCGNSVLPIAEHVFTALQARPDLARYLVICGGIGHSTEHLYHSVASHPSFQPVAESVSGLPEAQVLRTILDKFYDSPHITRSGLRILVEDKSTNCGANAIEARRILLDHGVKPESILLVQDPTMSLRTLASLEKAYANDEVPPNLKACPTLVPAVRLGSNGELSFDVPGMDSTSLWTMSRFLDLLMGEIPRLRDDADGYGPRGKGFIAHVDIPEAVASAYRMLQPVLQNRR
jgi:hypothetical protein